MDMNDVKNEQQEQNKPTAATNETTINDFLAQNVAKKDNVKVKMDRFKSPFVVKPLTATEMTDLQKQCSTKKRDRKTGQIITTMDQDLFQDKMIIKSIVTPDLNNEELQRSYGTIADAAGTLHAMLYGGEYTTLVQKVNEESGFDASMDDEVEDVKN
ncbi:hypothetical protein DY123_07230 [Apilactobacillus micheneri]|uniref:phage tail assembly chaperone n=1 Tax=Apilactobacillus micheneri TaxID=1899430 RepID=UPI00112E9A0C|nr:hypothetical protein [Apilactobacillus micheneri]TPR41275.1 hypothetical protein DY123_07230 [Apilactobacillus micheneri]